MLRFSHNGKSYIATSENVETYYGPELAVTVYDPSGKVVASSQECASIEMQVEWMIESGDLDCQYGTWS